ncbi:hypothetical protein LR48_Vigan375s000300 [Vigna angularis]|uniref:Uncharacterized protein n=1 Tax=Phaseolus angularis TaxID=3914 RepID=A0A0L9T8Y3_PHAAN|nr:hypothetical protein LR48_Vigan375s000300 [Vigna angularis]
MTRGGCSSGCGSTRMRSSFFKGSWTTPLKEDPLTTFNIHHARTEEGNSWSRRPAMGSTVGVKADDGPDDSAQWSFLAGAAVGEREFGSLTPSMSVWNEGGEAEPLGNSSEDDGLLKLAEGADISGGLVKWGKVEVDRWKIVGIITGAQERRVIKTSGRRAGESGRAVDEQESQDERAPTVYRSSHTVQTSLASSVHYATVRPLPCVTVRPHPFADRRSDANAKPFGYLQPVHYSTVRPFVNLGRSSSASTVRSSTSFSTVRPQVLNRSASPVYRSVIVFIERSVFI